MKLLSIEPTPSPNVMKLNVDERLPDGVQRVYTKETTASLPDLIRKLLAIEGVTSIFHTADFFALERKSTADWQRILTQAREAFGPDGEVALPAVAQEAGDTCWGEAQVYIQMFRGIPMQVKVTMGTEQVRTALPERFGKAAVHAGSASPNLIMERKWVEHGVRYGDLREIGEVVAQEIDAAYPQERVDELVKLAMQQEPGEAPLQPERRETKVVTLEMLDDPDWQKRYAALDGLEPTEADLPVLIKALHDPKASIRRLAVVYLGMVGGDAVLPHLFEALRDESVSVRRTAGDTLSDLGDPRAIGPMAEALKDPNKLVRWRAARFLYEVGDESALEALRAAQDEPEFEVRLQIKMALERIESGEAASGTVWQQMTRRNEQG
ncbi:MULTISPECIES: virulence factor [Bacillales]|jgi:HEAT repeat protein|uniref:Virulence factor n=1 Tax=Brevibacillus aydinogluensis TaxID=927786 RepID=A0AA48MBN3_9BACL|nr:MULTISPECIES: virulence factor [Bacillales]REK64606.1 MAG: virulence factor [Brevibacillus sp.]MBR8659351.1 virulence factor [Brevibacillus sp. NL20B1]MDT3414488.1 HEAT repeat protein [Brevibacillus aydinogluensis]NNV02504.1 virulence factor [Brevibacillus sp. MCWH]UFJ60069.1 virulence factor [Anoxybacillus sediminis]